MNTRPAIFAQKLRIYCDFDGTLTRFSGSQTWSAYQAHARKNRDSYPPHQHVIGDAENRGACYDFFLRANQEYQLLSGAKAFILNMLDHPMVEFVIVSRSYKAMIQAALNIGGIDSSRVMVLDIDDAGFEKKKWRAIANYEKLNPSQGPLLFIDDTKADAEDMKSAFDRDTQREKKILTAAAGKFDFSEVILTVDKMLASKSMEVALVSVGNSSLWGKPSSTEPAANAKDETLQHQGQAGKFGVN